MKNKFSSIDFDELKEGQFIVIEYDLTDKSYILGRVKTKTKIEKISKSDRIHLDAIETSFCLENYITKKNIER